MKNSREAVNIVVREDGEGLFSSLRSEKIVAERRATRRRKKENKREKRKNRFAARPSLVSLSFSPSFSDDDRMGRKSQSSTGSVE
jgi:hypothetical protein